MSLPVANGASRINSFALVTYIPEPLGSFLDEVRRELEQDAPHCRSHVTLLPPRPVSNIERAIAQVQAGLAAATGLVLEAGDVSLFESTSVVHLTVKAGYDELIRAHRLFNAGELFQVEAFEYCPHITLAQTLRDAQVERAIEHVRRRWEDYRGPRRFPIEALTFVQNTTANCWADVKEWVLVNA